MPAVLDACAVIAFLRDEPGADIVEQQLITEPPDCVIHAVNLCEVFYDFLKRSDEESAVLAVDVIRSIGVIVREDMDESFWRQAGRYKARYRVSLGHLIGRAFWRRNYHQRPTRL